MKGLQNNFTTPEQSKRLLELGVPADSADCYIDLGDGHRYIREPLDYETIYDQSFFEYYDIIFIPCWSVGRMIEIMQVCRTSDVYGYIAFFHDTNNLIDHIISHLEEPQWYDFSKL